MSRRWTEPQQWAIEDRGGTLLLSAAAGSGKTAVLVERVVSLLSHGERPLDVTQLLIVTFSNAAAAEMRQRIGQRLSQLIAENPDDFHLRRQQSLLSSAQIKTVHAYCMDLIRENFQYLPVSPDFSIMDEKELDILKEEVLSQCIEQYYQEDETQAFSQLVELLSTGRDDRRLMEAVYQIYDFARSHPFYESWLDEMLAHYDTGKPAGQTLWGRTLLDYTKETLEYVKESLEDTRQLLVGDEILEKAYLPAWDSDLAQIDTVLELIEREDWDRAVLALRSFHFERLRPVRGMDEIKKVVQPARKNAQKLIGDLPDRYLNATEKEFRGDIEDLQPKIQLLFQLVKDFGRLLDKEKQERKKLDFSDLEHYALQLLVKEVEGGYAPTHHAEQVAEQFAYVLVDEYQDTNMAQDLLFTALSGGGERLFMVGDVKQSIYSFRQAMPEIFIQKRREFHQYDPVHTQHPATISLDTNFRSRQEVTQGVNYIFTQLMSENLGEIDYDEDESLKAGKTFPDNPDCQPELLLINAEEYDGNLEVADLEGLQIAKKIKQMIAQGFQVEDKGTLRTARPSDFCILMRSPRGRTESYLKALDQVGLSGVADSGGSFLDAREISAVVSLLMALDNPLLDVDFVAAIMSPMFGFTDDHVAAIRLASPGTSFYSAVVHSAREGEKKCQQLLELFEDLRYYAANHPADQLLLEIYRRTHWLEIVRAMPYGQGRRANLLLLVEYASHYHSVGYKGLGGFVALLHRLRETGGDLDGAGGAGRSANAVQILSVHKSKGLEFPVVILADSARQFNMQDLRQNTLLHSSYGFACVRRDPETLVQFQTIPMGAIRLEMQKTMLSEEMRILYVALTRAKEKLIISGTISRGLERRMARQNLPLSPKTKKVPSFMVGERNNYLDWILMALLHHPDGEELHELGGTEYDGLWDDGNPWKITVVPAEEEISEDTLPEKEWKAQPDADFMALLKERTDYTYPADGDTRTPSKLAVSEVAGRKQAAEYRFSRRPRFLSREKLTPTERGNALHHFMQFANYENARDDVEKEIARMGSENYLTSAEIDSLSRESLQTFFQSPLIQRIFASPKVKREVRFVTEFGREELASLYPDMGPESKIVLQGVADCVFFEEGQAVILDYKTDRVKDMAQLVSRYREQVLIYKSILEATLGTNVKEGLLYSFHLSQWVDILAL